MYSLLIFDYFNNQERLIAKFFKPYIKVITYDVEKYEISINNFMTVSTHLAAGHCQVKGNR